MKDYLITKLKKQPYWRQWWLCKENVKHLLQFSHEVDCPQGIRDNLGALLGAWPSSLKPVRNYCHLYIKNKETPQKNYVIDVHNLREIATYIL